MLHAVGDRHPEPSRVRIHRAISWLARAEAEADDPDARFVFLWIAFNAAYAQEFGSETSTRQQLEAFFARLVGLDGDKRLAGLLFSQFTGPIRTLIDNKFVFEPFWKAMREHDPSDHWEREFHGSNKAALRALMGNRADKVLCVVFARLYVLRNQLLHGGATWNSSINRAQVKDGANLLSALLPVILELMLAHPDVDFGEILYPVLPP
ncbi:MAG TPA: hypothetical protein VFG73_10745 [Rhodanobacteraceae bacterium]|nr:hypothetical protein [Rhodanobacteraceae bacterium]